MVLLRRGLKERRHESYSGLRIFQVLSVSFLSGLLWWHSDPSNIQDQVLDQQLITVAFEILKCIFSP